MVLGVVGDAVLGVVDNPLGVANRRDNLFTLRLFAHHHSFAAGIIASSCHILVCGETAYLVVAVVERLYVERLIGVEVLVALPGEGGIFGGGPAFVLLLILEEGGVGALYVVIARGYWVVALQQGLPRGLQLVFGSVVGVLVAVVIGHAVGIDLGGAEGVEEVLRIYVGRGAALGLAHGFLVGSEVVKQRNLAGAGRVFTCLHQGESLPGGIVLVGVVRLVGHGDDAAGAAAKGVGAQRGWGRRVDMHHLQRGVVEERPPADSLNGARQRSLLQTLVGAERTVGAQLCNALRHYHALQFRALGESPEGNLGELYGRVERQFLQVLASLEGVADIAHRVGYTVQFHRGCHVEAFALKLGAVSAAALAGDKGNDAGVGVEVVVHPVDELLYDHGSAVSDSHNRGGKE